MYRGRGSGWGWAPGWGWGYLPYSDDIDSTDFQPHLNLPLNPPLFIARQPEREIQPILLERHGDEWVTVTNARPTLAAPQPEEAKPEESTHLRAALPGRSQAAEPPIELPPAVLVFRDGHEEEVRGYTIIGNTLYAKADYWSSGAWTRKIEIASLDVPATLKLNAQRGSNFRLPSGPLEVMIRP
jgi:hypothetical protein